MNQASDREHTVSRQGAPEGDCLTHAEVAQN